MSASTAIPLRYCRPAHDGVDRQRHVSGWRSSSGSSRAADPEPEAAVTMSAPWHPDMTGLRSAAVPRRTVTRSPGRLPSSAVPAACAARSTGPTPGRRP